MGIESWKREFYKSIDRAIKDDISAVKHSLVKWNGLLPENLKAHNLESIHDDCIVVGRNGAKFEINGDTCALCVAHNFSDCDACPLFKTLGNRKCYTNRGFTSVPFDVYQSEGNPVPMIKALEKTLKRLEKA